MVAKEEKRKITKYGIPYIGTGKNRKFQCRVCKEFKDNVIAAHTGCNSCLCLDCLRNRYSKVEKNSNCKDCQFLCSDGYTCGFGKN